MEYKELQQALSQLEEVMNNLEELYILNEGECTEESERMEVEVDTLKELLSGDGIDMLGRWLKSKEDRKNALKAEKDYITRQIASIDKGIEYIKSMINKVMVATGLEKVKGDRGYSFATTTSTKTDINKDVLKALYADKVEEAIRSAHIPAYVGVSLTASSTKATELGVVEGDEDIFVTMSKPSVRFGKPKANTEDF